MLIPRELIIEAKEKYGEKAAFVIAKDLELKEFDEKNLKSICKFHDEETPSLIWSKEINAFKCFGCQKVYGILDHYMIFYKLTFLGAVERLFNETDISFRFGERGVKTQREYIYPHEEISDRTKVENYWNTRCISPATLDFGDIGADENGNTVFHYYDLNDILCVVKYRPSKKVDKGEKFKFWTQKNADTLPLLYGMNKIDPTKPLLVVEGEADRLSVIECSHKNVVSIPFGAGNTQWIEHNWDWLEQFQEIIVWSDNDKVGVDMRKEVCSRLGSWRTKYVDLPIQLEKDGKLVKVKDANEVLFHFGKQKVIDFINNAQDFPVPDVLDLYDAEDFNIETAPGLVTGLKSLNEILYKFLFGSVVVLTGLRGSGKSTFANQTFICDALNQGESAYIYSGELGSSILRNWIETTLIGRENIEMKDEFVRKFNLESKQQMRDWYKGRIWVYDGQTNDSDAVLDKAVAVTRKLGAKIWLIDNLTSLTLSGDDPKKSLWEKQKDFMVKLVSLAKTYNVLVALIIHPRKMSGNDVSRDLEGDDVGGAGELTNLAQYIIATHRYTKKEKDGEKNKRGDGYVKGREPVDHDVKILVKKNRPTGRLGEANFFFDFNAYRFYDSPKSLWRRYTWCKDTSPLRTDDPNKHSIEVPSGFGED